MPVGTFSMKSKPVSPKTAGNGPSPPCSGVSPPIQRQSLFPRFSQWKAAATLSSRPGPKKPHSFCFCSLGTRGTAGRLVHRLRFSRSDPSSFSSPWSLVSQSLKLTNQYSQTRYSGSGYHHPVGRQKLSSPCGLCLLLLSSGFTCHCLSRRPQSPGNTTYTCEPKCHPARMEY